MVIEAKNALRSPVRPNELMGTESWPVRLYLAIDPPTPGQVRGPAKPREWGWLQVDAPLETEDTLYLAEVAISDREKTSAARPPATKLFDRVASRLRRRLHGPITITNTRTGQSMTAATPLFSSGAAEFARSGGLLRQYAVPNVSFSPN
jgi:hypothetical protein